jgi:hypothetical protein
MLGFAKFESASRFCIAFDELRNYLRIRATEDGYVPASEGSKIFTDSQVASYRDFGWERLFSKRINYW